MFQSFFGYPKDRKMKCLTSRVVAIHKISEPVIPLKVLQQIWNIGKFTPLVSLSQQAHLQGGTPQLCLLVYNPH